MAAMLKLVRTGDFVADLDTVDLLASGFSLAENGYAPAVASIGARSVVEPITLTLEGSSSDDLALMVQDLDSKTLEVQRWIENSIVERYQVWIRVQMEGETYARQAQLLNIRPPDKVNMFSNIDTSEHTIVDYTFAIERTPYWEEDTSSDAVPTYTLSCVGGMATITGTNSGDVPARTSLLQITPAGANQPMAQCWLGVKSTRFGNPNNFVPRWDLYLSEHRGADTTIVADTSTVNGVSKLQCSFATTATLVNRCIILVSDVAASNPNDQRGTYNVLLRAKMSDTSVARAWMAYSFGAGTTLFNPVYRRRQPISGTTWKLYPMGTASIPAMRIAPYLDISNAGIGIDAERYSGSGNLDIDCLILIPIDDGAIYLETASRVNLAAGENFNVIQDPDGSLRTYTTNGSNAIYFPSNLSPSNWQGLFNHRGGQEPNLVFASQAYTVSSSENDKADQGNVSYNYVQRWRTLRGSGASGT